MFLNLQIKREKFKYKNKQTFGSLNIFIKIGTSDIILEFEAVTAAVME